eukprot:TRINITY_DN48_c1_g2_i2.p1 TRINITY_DN48_c1_g2~~TRINITY_DN48_c1_g2_i2.p1  ORF type:complete len:945 (+),score=228.49 TRINITY_DN48_c1_g2_i2:14-2848(+)
MLAGAETQSSDTDSDGNPPSPTGDEESVIVDLDTGTLECSTARSRSRPQAPQTKLGLEAVPPPRSVTPAKQQQQQQPQQQVAACSPQAKQAPNRPQPPLPAAKEHGAEQLQQASAKPAQEATQLPECARPASLTKQTQQTREGVSTVGTGSAAAVGQALAEAITCVQKRPNSTPTQPALIRQPPQPAKETRAAVQLQQEALQQPEHTRATALSKPHPTREGIVSASAAAAAQAQADAAAAVEERSPSPHTQLQQHAWVSRSPGTPPPQVSLTQRTGPAAASPSLMGRDKRALSTIAGKPSPPPVPPTRGRPALSQPALPTPALTSDKKLVRPLPAGAYSQQATSPAVARDPEQRRKFEELRQIAGQVQRPLQNAAASSSRELQTGAASVGAGSPPPIRVTVVDSKTNTTTTMSVTLAPDVTVQQMRGIICRKNNIEERPQVVKLTDSGLVCPLDVTVADLDFQPVTVCPAKEYEEGDELLVYTDFTLQNYVKMDVKQTKAKDVVTVVVTDAETGARCCVTSPLDLSVAQIIVRAREAARLPLDTQCHLEIPEIGLSLATQYSSHPLRSLSFVQACFMTGIPAVFELATGMPPSDADPTEVLAALIMKELWLFELVGSTFVLTVKNGKEEVNDARRAFAKLQQFGEFDDVHGQYHAEAIENNFVYVDSEPPIKPSNLKVTFVCSFPGLLDNMKKMACTCDTPVSQVVEAAFRKYALVVPDAAQGGTAADFVLKVHGLNEYLVTHGEDGQPLTFGQFDYIRRCVLKNLQPYLSLVLRGRAPGGGGDDNEERERASALIGKLLARHVPQLPEAHGGTSGSEEDPAPIPMCSLGRRFKVKIDGVSCLTWPVNDDGAHAQYRVYAAACLYHGGTALDDYVFTPVVAYDEAAQFPNAKFVGWGRFLPFHLSLPNIPLEARLYFTVYATNEAVGVTPTRVDPCESSISPHF